MDQSTKDNQSANTTLTMDKSPMFEDMSEIRKPSFSTLRKPYANTPFYMVKDEEGFFIAFREYILTKKCPTEQDAIDSLENNKWNAIMWLCIGTHDAIEQEAAKNITNQNPE